MRRDQDWLRQARRDLRHAENAAGDADYEWACFAAHQAAEKALKALLQFRSTDAWGHSLTFLLDALRSTDPAEPRIVDLAKLLDKHYIPPRYPDAHPAGAPMDFYTSNEAKQAIAAAREVLAFVEGRIAPPPSPSG